MPTYVYKFVDTGETVELQQSFDDPTPTFFNAWIYRYAFLARYLPDVLVRYELKPEVEFLRTPAGMAVVGGVTLLVALGVARRVRNRNR